MSVYFIVEMSVYFNGVWIDTEDELIHMTREGIAACLGRKWKVDPEREDPNTFYQEYGKMKVEYYVTHRVWGDTLATWDFDPAVIPAWDEAGRSEDLPTDSEGFYSPPVGEDEWDDDLPF